MNETHAALIVTEMQNRFINDRSRSVIPKVVELVEHWETTGRPVVFTRYHNYPGSPFERLIHWSSVQSPRKPGSRPNWWSMLAAPER